jgi:hypothetical protein
MRRFIQISLAVLLVIMIGGPVLAKNANNCASQKWALERALAIFMDAEKACNNAIDAMADAYGDLATATKNAQDLAKQMNSARTNSTEAWAAFRLCRQQNPESMCEKSYQAAKTADARYENLVHEHTNAEQALVAAQIALDNAKANFKAKSAAEAEAKEALDKARADLAKCLNRPRMR